MSDNSNNNVNNDQEEQTTTWGQWFTNNWWWILPLLVLLLAGITAGIVWYMRSSSLTSPQITPTALPPQSYTPSVPVTTPQAIQTSSLSSPQVTSTALPPQSYTPFVPVTTPQVIPTSNHDFDFMSYRSGVKSWTQNGRSYLQMPPPDNRVFSTQYPPSR